jgi:acetolactate synthase-1/2/3 large subunit
MKASDLFVRALEAEGVKYVFGIPGEENLDFLESLRATSSIKLILTRHEQAAGFMAATWGRLTGKAGVCLATLGPGATNFVTPAAYAQLGAMPMLMITGQKPVKASKQGHFQIVDVVDMMKPMTKYTRQIVASDNIPARARGLPHRRGGKARRGPPRTAGGHRRRGDGCQCSEGAASCAGRQPRKSIRHAVKAIDQSEAPAAGDRRRRPTARPRPRCCCEFIDKTRHPLLHHPDGQGRHRRAPSLVPGLRGAVGRRLRPPRDRGCRLHHQFGHDVIEKPPFFMRKGLRTVIHLNFFSAEVDTVYFPQIEVVGDMANSIWRLKQRLEPQAHWDFGYFNQVRDALNKHLALRSDDERFPIHPVKMVGIIRDEVDKNGIVCLDNGMYKLWFARYYRCHEPNTMLLDNALATMGAGLPSAMAAKMVHPDRKVVAVAGDGGFMMNSQELETAVRYNLNIAVIVLRDNAYGMIKWKQSGMGFDNFGMDMGNPDFVKLAEAFGARGWRPKSTEEFRQNLRQALAEPGVDLIELAIDYSENHAILNKEIKELSAAM